MSINKDWRFVETRESAKRQRQLSGEVDIEIEMDVDVEELEEFNTSHSESGEFSTKEDERCDSSYFVSGKRKRKTGPLTNVKLTGQGKRKGGQGIYRCKDNSKKFENQKPFGDVVQDKQPCRKMDVDEILQLIKEVVDECYGW